MTSLTKKQDIKMFSSVKIQHEEVSYNIPFSNGIGQELTSSEFTGELLKNLIGNSAQEYVYAFYLDCHLELIGIAPIALGSSTEALVSDKAIFQHALLCNADNIIVGHNHPTGKLVFSNNDIQTFHRLENAGSFLGIRVLDFFVVSDTSYRSIREDQQI